MSELPKSTELFHYTGLSGLEGIIRTQSLRATHFAFLNDMTELRTFEQRLIKILHKALALSDQDSYAEDMAVSMREIALGNRVKNTPAMAEPFITSFCKARTKEISEHGLLSQWRAYGEEGGYAVVFDGARLTNMLTHEAEKWSYALMFSGDVIYSTQSQEFHNDLSPHVSTIIEALTQFRKDKRNPHPLEQTFLPYMQCAGFYKHWGFHEENEFRILAIPFGKSFVEKYKDRNLNYKFRSSFARRGTLIPCINLLEGIAKVPENALPITRIIIGPHPQRENRHRAIQDMVEQFNLPVDVTVSDIPFVGHS